jgi:hypothetical protein
MKEAIKKGKNRKQSSCWSASHFKDDCCDVKNPQNPEIIGCYSHHTVED